ncbi:MAG: MOSC domain-containing protein [Elusimicrobia bacterium]|nr:MOSC domain-containing protein [Elusimicrobiota bacterium]
MNILSIQIGRAKSFDWKGEAVATAIFKSPVPAATIGKLGLSGDQQADLTVHGGPDKAVYGYSAVHYHWWKAQLPGVDLPYGVFGENLTIEGFDDSAACLGDLYRAGGAVLEAVQPRLPCSKLGLRFNDPAMVKRFASAGRFGVYFRVLEDGPVKVGDRVEKIFSHAEAFPVYELARLYFDPGLTEAAAARALSHPALNDNWREMLSKRLKKA